MYGYLNILAVLQDKIETIRDVQKITIFIDHPLTVLAARLEFR